MPEITKKYQKDFEELNYLALGQFCYVKLEFILETYRYKIENVLFIV